MERLTNSGTKEPKPNVTIREILDRLAEYEDLEEQGKLLKLPYMVGNIVYRTNPLTREPVAVEIESIYISDSGINISGRTTKRRYSVCFGIFDINKTVFFTKEEAEAALKELPEELLVQPEGTGGSQ